MADMSTDIGRLSTDTHVRQHSVDTRPILNPTLCRRYGHLLLSSTLFNQILAYFLQPCETHLCILCGKGPGDGCYSSKTTVNNTDPTDSPPIHHRQLTDLLPVDTRSTGTLSSHNSTLLDQTDQYVTSDQTRRAAEDNDLGQFV